MEIYKANPFMMDDPPAPANPFAAAAAAADEPAVAVSGNPFLDMDVATPAPSNPFLFADAVSPQQQQQAPPPSARPYNPFADFDEPQPQVFLRERFLFLVKFLYSFDSELELNFF